MPIFLLALAGALGTLARHYTGLAVTRALGQTFPIATLLINIAGSAVIGLAAARLQNPATRLVVMTGLCGGFTTFSAFSLQTLELLQQNRPLAAAANVALSVTLCLAATGCAYTLATRL